MYQKAHYCTAIQPLREQTCPPQPGNSSGTEKRHSTSPKQKLLKTLTKEANADLELEPKDH